MLQALVPGLPQIRTTAPGMRFLGWLTLSAWCTALFLSLAFVGTGFATLLGFACVSVHCFSISLILTPHLQGTALTFRLFAGIAIYLLVLLGIYWPALTGVRQVARVLPVTGLRHQGAIANGDVLLYTGAWTRPAAWKRGDLVVATVAPINLGHAYIQSGINVDRIVATEGDSVKLNDGVLSINGEPQSPEFLPLGPIDGLPALDFDLPENTCLVLPTTFTWGNPGSADSFRRMVSSIAVIPADAIEGRVLLRIRPWTRIGFPRNEKP
jgi:signal peptidase I